MSHYGFQFEPMIYIEVDGNMVPDPADVPPQMVKFKAHKGYLTVEGTPFQAQHLAEEAVVTLTGDAIEVVKAGLTLDEAHATLTDGKTKAELVALGADLGLSLSESSLKAELLDAIRDYLSGLAP